MGTNNWVEGSTEQHRSPMLALVKFWIYRALNVKLIIRTRSDAGRYIIALEDSYRVKPSIYEQIAYSLKAGVITCSVSLWPFHKNVNHEVREIVLWSDVQILPRLLLRKYWSTLQYQVYQHGVLAYDDETLRGPSSLEWLNTRANVYYVWSTEDKAQIARFRPALNTKVIRTPVEGKRSIRPGFGFATRGPEYWREDFRYFKATCPLKSTIAVYFHPSYPLVKKTAFMLACALGGFRVKIGDRDTIAEHTITLSCSIKRLLSER